MKKLLLIFLIFTTGCAGNNVITPPQSFVYKEIKTNHFTLASWQKIENANKDFKIYIEGDGNSFTHRGHPTSDPTPRGGTLRNIAFADTYPNVIYLARPCQFVDDKVCVQTDWTTGRFSKNAVDSSAEAIKSITNKNVKLIGFSGGAQIAGLVAVMHPEIKTTKIITIAGNLDHVAWATKKRLIPLSDSLSLADYRDEFLKIPQLHYVGGNDNVVPASVTYDFVGDKDLVIYLPDATHTTGWVNVNTN